jgi:hypothetical protein
VSVLAIKPAKNLPGVIPAFWNHVNSVNKNSASDQILLSARNSNLIWIIDHSTGAVARHADRPEIDSAA